MSKINTTSARRGLSLVLEGFSEPIVWALGITQTIGYGTLYYAFGVLADPISASFGLSIDKFFMVLTVALIVGGFAAPFVGRLLDHWGARRVMTVGSFGATLGLVLCSFSTNFWTFALSFAFTELMACLVLYEAAFAGLTQFFAQSARARISAITLIAGFASTLFWPLTVWLSSNFGWSSTLLIFAAVNLLVCLPLHAFVLPIHQPTQTQSKPLPQSDALAIAAQNQLRQRNFVFFTTAICISGIIYAAFPVHMLRIIGNQGFTPEAAALVAMVMGPSQVLARIIDIAAGQQFDALITGRACMLALVASCFVLLGTQGWPIGAYVFAALYGVSQGLVSIVRGTVPLLLFGTEGYATLMGRITGLRFFINAFAPFAFGWLAVASSVSTTIAVFSLAAILACAAMFMLKRPIETH